MIVTDAVVPTLAPMVTNSEIPSIFEPTLTYPGDECCSLYASNNFGNEI